MTNVCNECKMELTSDYISCKLCMKNICLLCLQRHEFILNLKAGLKTTHRWGLYELDPKTKKYKCHHISYYNFKIK